MGSDDTSGPLSDADRGTIRSSQIQENRFDVSCIDLTRPNSCGYHQKGRRQLPCETRGSKSVPVERATDGLGDIHLSPTSPSGTKIHCGSTQSAPLEVSAVWPFVGVHQAL